MTHDFDFWRSDIAPDYEPVRVLISRGQWVDETRDGRVVPYKIYYPELLAPQPLPVIIWSHGLGGTQDGAGFIARFLAAHGYIHVNIGHEGTNDSLWRGKTGHPWDNIRKAHIPWETVLDRYADIPFALDQLEIIKGSGEPYAPLMDMARIGMSGHSFGAMTTQIMAGQMTGNPDPLHLFEPRFTAGIAYSPVPNARLKANDAFVYGDMRLPLFHLTGSEDHSPIDGPVQHLRDAIFDHAGGDTHAQLSVILDGADHMVFNGSRGQLPDYEGMDRHKDQIKILALAWWDAWLKNDDSAWSFMDQRVHEYLGMSDIIKRKNWAESMT